MTHRELCNHGPMIVASEIPPGALLQTYRVDGTFADCYRTTLPGRIPLAAFVEAFYTTRLFKLERLILALVGRPSTDEDACRLARGASDTFAAWTVEGRNEHELLLCDMTGRTRSWLMVSPDGDDSATRLYFGSAVVPQRDRKSGEPRLGAGFSALLGFHKRYSVALLGAARRALAKSASG